MENVVFLLISRANPTKKKRNSSTHGNTSLFVWNSFDISVLLLVYFLSTQNNSKYSIGLPHNILHRIFAQFGIIARIIFYILSHISIFGRSANIFTLWFSCWLMWTNTSAQDDGRNKKNDLSRFSLALADGSTSEFDKWILRVRSHAIAVVVRLA